MGIDFNYVTLSEILTAGRNVRKSIIFALIDVTTKTRGHRKALLNRDKNFTAVRKVTLGKGINSRVWWINEIAKL